MIRALLRRVAARDIDGVTVERVDATSPPLRLYTPKVRESDAALLWIHGGGFVLGHPSQDDRFCALTARKLGIVIASADYCQAPEHPFPAPLDDCYAAWRWVRQSAAGLGIDPSRIVVGGQSAGGGLAASLVQRLHDAGEDVLGQWLFCPMLDDRTAGRRELDKLRHRVWDNRKNAFAWRSFLGAEPGAGDVPLYAAASRLEDLRGLPPAWIGVGEIDLFYDEDRRYAERLEAAGVPVALTTVPGAPHGFEAWAPDTGTAKTFIGTAHEWLRCRLGES